MEDNELIALLDRKFAEQDQRFEARFAQMDARFGQMDEKFDNLRIEVGARLDDMHTDIKKIAEGVDNVDEKLERFRKETARSFKDVNRRIGLSNAALNKRLTKLEKAS